MRTKLCLIAFLLAVLIGCGATPVKNVVDSPVNVSGSNFTLTDVQNAIIQAGTNLGWQMQPSGPGHIIGTLYIRTHMAQVDVHYDRQNYDITYRNSSNLDYDEGKIHGRYNKWVENLDNAIQARLAGTSSD